MGKKRERPNPMAASEGAGFDMTPMIDVTFLLIIFFMCVTELADASKAKLVLPQADKATEIIVVPNRLVVNVVKDGTIKILGVDISEKALDDILKRESVLSKNADNKEVSDRAVMIRADKETEYGKVQFVMAACMKHKLWRIAFASKDPAPGTQAE